MTGIADIGKKRFLKDFLINLAISLGISGYILFETFQTESRITLLNNPEIIDYIRYALSQQAVWLDILQFFAGFILLHATWALFGTWLFHHLPLPEDRKRLSTFLRHSGFLIASLWLLAINGLFYRHSHAAIFKDTFLSDPATILAGGLLITLLAIRAALASYRQYPRAVPASLGLLVVLSLTTGFRHAEPQESASDPRPNIIILGIDALRPDHLGINGFSPSVTPFLDSLLEDALVFDDAYTPLARTYCAWESILTGNYPAHNGARFNLMPPEKVDRKNTISAQLQKLGYYTIYALDERRFNNIDESYGFDAVVGPKAGAADTLLSPFVDDYLINLVSNFSFSKTVFPFIYSNRGQYRTYDPFVFSREIGKALDRRSGRPVFLSAHLTLPHWPFINNAMPDIPGHLDRYDEENPIAYFYLSMLRMADAQLEDIYNQLERRGLLKNAMIFLISDHGEGLMLKGDGPEAAVPSAHFDTNDMGHGTNVVSHKQYHVLMAFRRMGGEFPTGRSNRPSSLVDIAPTIRSLLHIPQPDRSDGVSLFEEVPKDRPRFVESSINPAAISKKRLDVIHAIAEGIAMYTVNQQGRMVVKSELIDSLIASKQRAVFSDGWQLAYFPDMEDNLIVTDLGSNRWWPTTMAPDRGRVSHLLRQLCDFYKEDPGFDKNGYCMNPDEILPPANDAGSG